MLPVTAVNYDEGPLDEKFNLETAIECVTKKTNYHIEGSELHRGSYGRLYALCQARENKKAACKKVVKIVIVHPNSRYEKLEVEDIQRELYFLTKLNSTGLTPQLYESFGCGNYFNFVLQRFATNMTAIGFQQCTISKDLLESLLPPNVDVQKSLLYTSSQMKRMFDIALALGYRYDVIHGDLSPNQYLYPLASDLLDDKAKIVVTDFGFSGSTVEGKWKAKLGWHHTKQCGVFTPLPPKKYDDNPKKQELYRFLYNVYQLWFFFSYFPKLVYILDLNQKSIQVFPHHTMGFRQDLPYYLPPAVLDEFFNVANCGPIPPDPDYDRVATLLGVWQG